jgi:hypothetical protein
MYKSDMKLNIDDYEQMIGMKNNIEESKMLGVKNEIQHLRSDLSDAIIILNETV